MSKKAVQLVWLAWLVIFHAEALSAAEYYVSASFGNDANPGTFERPWKTIEKVNHFAFQAGDDVYFKCGDTFTPSQSLSVDWEGTASNRVVIGAYWLDGTVPKQGVNGSRPIISGSEYTIPAWGSWSGLVNIIKKDYITLQDLELYHSGGFGVQIAGDVATGENAAYFVVRNVFVNGSGRGGIYSNKNPYNYGLIEGCECAYNTRIKYVDKAVQNSTIYSTNSPYAYTTIRGNYVHHVWGEGIGSTRVNSGELYDNSGFAILENNIVMASISAPIYFDGAHNNIIRNNLIIGLGEEALGGPWYSGGFGNAESDGRFWTPSGIGVTTEVRLEGEEPASNNSIYNNMVVGCKYGIFLSQEIAGTSYNNKIFNNTFIGNRYNLRVQNVIGYSERILEGWEYKNNAHFCPSDTICENILGDALFIESEIEMDYNSWTSSAPAYAGNTNDVVILPTDTGFEKTAGLQELTGLISADNFKLKSVSHLIGKALNKSAVFTTDFFGKPRDAVWDIGAHQYTGQQQPGDTISPEIKSFIVVRNTSVQAGLIWRVSDTGGSHLAGIKVFRAVDSSGAPVATWKELTSEEIVFAIDVDTDARTIDDGTGSTGKYWYKIKVSDKAGNAKESAAVMVDLTVANAPPAAPGGLAVK